jgi:hypothetical protein
LDGSQETAVAGKALESTVSEVHDMDRVSANKDRTQERAELPWTLATSSKGSDHLTAFVIDLERAAAYDT